MKLIKTRIDQIVDALKNGAFIETACKIGKISKETYYTWQREGKPLFEDYDSGKRLKKDFSDREKKLSDFYEKTSAAEAEYELEILKAIRESPHRWQALAWILERRFRERYARRVMVDTELFLKHFEREHGSGLTMILQRVLDMAEQMAESKQTYDEAPLQGEQLQHAALPPTADEGN